MLGELEELKDRLEASEAARAAAERRAEEGAARCSGLEAKAERCQDLAQARRLPTPRSLQSHSQEHCRCMPTFAELEVQSCGQNFCLCMSMSAKVGS